MQDIHRKQIHDYGVLFSEFVRADAELGKQNHKESLPDDPTGRRIDPPFTPNIDDASDDEYRRWFDAVKALYDFHGRYR